MTDALHRTLDDLAAFLDDRRVPFAVINGIAVGVRGEPRFTADVDVILGIDLDGADTLVEALDASAFRPLFPDVAEVVRAAFILPVRHRETQIKVDMSIGLTGFERQLIRRATKIKLGSQPIPVATAEDMILLKLLASRPRDTDDAARIVARQQTALDWNFLVETAKALQEAVAQDIVSPLMQMRSE